MKLLLDQGLPRGAVELLREARIDATHTSEAGLATASDRRVLEYARRESRIVVTLDADFHAILALSAAPDPSTIRIRIEGLTAEPLAELVRLVLERCREDLTTGAMVSVTKHQVRIHRLPIRSASSQST